MADGDQLPNANDPLLGAAQPGQQPISPDLIAQGQQAERESARQKQSLQAPSLRPEMPAIVHMIAQMIKPTANVQPGQSADQLTRPSRLDAFEQFLGTFMTSFAHGLASSGTGPGANIRGAGAAMLAPQEQNIRQFGLNQQAASAQQQQAESAAKIQEQQAQTESLRPTIAMIDPDGNRVMVPAAHVGTALAGQYRMAGIQSAAQTKATSSEKIQGMKNVSAQDITARNIASKEKIAAASNQTRLTTAQMGIQARMNLESSREALQRDLTTQKLAVQSDPNKLTMPMRSMKQQAQALLPQIDRIEPMIDRVAGKLGPGAGRWNDFWQGKVGAKDPEFAKLKDEMGFLESGVALAHARGRMSDTIFNHFKTMFDAGKQDPANMHSAMQVARTWMTDYSHLGEGSAPAAGGGASVDDLLKKYPPK